MNGRRGAGQQARASRRAATLASLRRQPRPMVRGLQGDRGQARLERPGRPSARLPSPALPGVRRNGLAWRRLRDARQARIMNSECQNGRESFDNMENCSMISMAKS